MPVYKDLQKKQLFFLLLISGLILFSYSNSFYASWHLDDLPNITDNTQLHIDSLSYTNVVKTFTANPQRGKEGTWYRPIPMFTFAVTWYFDGDNTFYYHVVNVSIHIITALFLYLTIYHILVRTPYSQRNKKTHSSPQLIALLAVLLWALNPIHTQAITYIVQRMASIATMFYIMAIFFYLRARSADTIPRKIISFIIVSLCFLLAMGSKENAMTLPVALFLIEFLFLQNLELKQTKQRLIVIFFSICLLFFFFGSFLFLNGEPLSFLGGYKARSFTLVERLLTEPRVVLNYLYQIFYPVTSHLSFEHDITLSQSLLKPWTTLPSILGLTVIFTSGLLTYRKAPFYSFAVLFFFLNHLIESTVIPLEIIFEHRNYLPSMFLFVPVSLALFYGIEQCQKKSPILSKMLIVFSISLVLLSGFSTYSRNEVWATEGTLWEDTYKKAPNSARAAHNLGRWHRQHGQFNEALVLFKQAEQLAEHAALPDYTKANALNGQGTIYYYVDSPDRAIKAFKDALTVSPGFEASRKNLALTFLKTKKWSKALQETSKLTKKYPNNPEYLYLHAVALLRNKQPELSLTFAESAMQRSPDNLNYMLTCAASYKALKNYHNAKYYLYQYDKIEPGKLLVGLALLEISILEHDTATIEKMMDMIQQKYSTEEVTKALKDNQFIPLHSYEILGLHFDPVL